MQNSDRGLAEYIANHYGTCSLGSSCEHIGQDAKPWIGVMCPHWNPTKAKNWEELRLTLLETKHT